MRGARLTRLTNTPAWLRCIADAGHQLLWDAPDVVENVLRPFVDRCATHTEVRT